MLCKLRNIMGNSKRRYFPKSVAWFCSCYQKWKIYLTANHNQGFQSNYSQNDNTKWSKVFGKFFHPGLNESFSRVKICHQNNVSGWSKVFHFHLLPSKILCFTFLITGSGLVGKGPTLGQDWQQYFLSQSVIYEIFPEKSRAIFSFPLRSRFRPHRGLRRDTCSWEELELCIYEYTRSVCSAH